MLICADLVIFFIILIIISQSYYLNFLQVFLKLAHALASYDSKNLYNVRPNNMNDYFLTMKPYENKINLIKAALEYIVKPNFYFKKCSLNLTIQNDFKNLSGSDPRIPRTKLLFVKSKEPLSIFKVNKTFVFVCYY
jgi:hypothetical protein